MQRIDLAQFELPEEPGIYRFQKGRKILYIGKATSLRDRVRSYFNTGLTESRSTAIAGMVGEADTITWEETDSVLEALILEANAIKKHEPFYNSLEKDNKSFNYLVITKEKYPMVTVVRGRELFTNWKTRPIKYLFGPFTQGSALREAMKLVRHIFPYRDTKCTPESGKPCFNRQIGLCPGVCTGEMNKKEYATTIKHIVLLFSGKKRVLLKQLERDMKLYAKLEKFEKAETSRRQVGALTHIRDISLIKDESRFATGGVIRSKGGNRIEAYDIAHTSGTETVGVMVTVEDSEPLKSAYRKFKVRGYTNNDPGALAEILSRRLLHPEWQYPRIIVVDGSTAQMNAVKK